MTLRGADPSTVRTALAEGIALPGTGGFAGEVDGRLVRDVLGRHSVFVDGDHPGHWSFEPTDLTAPTPVPAGHVVDDETPSRCWTLPERPAEYDHETATSLLRTALDETFRAVDGANLAIAFSGGVDSALLAAALDAPLYAVGFPDSHDLTAASSAADHLGLDLRTIELDHQTLEAAIPGVARATGRTNAMDVQIALGTSLVAKRVSADGFDRLALGQGADELFGGYAKVAMAPGDHRVNAETVRGARREVLLAIPDQLERDGLAIRAHGVEPVRPLLHDRVVRVALGLSGDQLVATDGTRKWIFRRAARAWLPDTLAAREKKAMQYGSLIAREVDRLARQAGFKRRMDDHVSQYVESVR